MSKEMSAVVSELRNELKQWKERSKVFAECKSEGVYIVIGCLERMTPCLLDVKVSVKLDQHRLCEIIEAAEALTTLKIIQQIDDRLSSIEDEILRGEI